jgi:hypothetical protein
MTPDTFARLGELIHGERWVHRMAKDLGVDERTIRRWAAGTSAIKPGVWRDLVDVMERRGVAMIDEARALREGLQPGD